MAVYAPDYSGYVYAYGSYVPTGFGPDSYANAGYTLSPIGYDPYGAGPGVGSADPYSYASYAYKLDTSYTYAYSSYVSPDFNPNFYEDPSYTLPAISDNPYGS